MNIKFQTFFVNGYNVPVIIYKLELPFRSQTRQDFSHSGSHASEKWEYGLFKHYYS